MVWPRPHFGLCVSSVSCVLGSEARWSKGFCEAAGGKASSQSCPQPVSTLACLREATARVLPCSCHSVPASLSPALYLSWKSRVLPAGCLACGHCRGLCLPRLCRRGAAPLAVRRGPGERPASSRELTAPLRLRTEARPLGLSVRMEGDFLGGEEPRPAILSFLTLSGPWGSSCE